jgi:lipopolysaccharide assembly protein A
MVFRSKRSAARATPDGASGATADPDEMDAPDVRATPEPSHVAKAGKTAPRTRISSAWTAVAVGLLFLIALLIFIFQNLENVRVTFITFHASFPLALSLLCASVAGAVVVLLLGVARIIQLRRVARHHRNAAAAARTS